MARHFSAEVLNMIWLNLNVSVLDSPEFLGCDPVERATWLCLLRYCIGQENGGRIPGCRTWKDRQWQQLVRITSAEVSAACDLWEWMGDDLLVTHYPLEKESEVVTKRGKARENGKLGGRPKSQNPPINNPEVTNVGFFKEPSGNPAHNPEGTQPESGKERKGMEGEGNGKRESESAGEPADVDLENVRLMDSVIAAYPKNGNEMEAKRALALLSLTAPDLLAIREKVLILSKKMAILPESERRFCPAKHTFFSERRWNDDPNQAPWTAAPDRDAKKPLIPPLKPGKWSNNQI